MVRVVILSVIMFIFIDMMTIGTMTPGVITVSIMILSITILIIMILCTAILVVMLLYITVKIEESKNSKRCYSKCNYCADCDDCRYAECHCAKSLGATKRPL